MITDPAIGDRLLVITALGPTRGFVRPRDYVELHAARLGPGRGGAPIADDVAAALAPNKITLGRPGGLSLSTAEVGAHDAARHPAQRAAFDTQIWGFDRKAEFRTAPVRADPRRRRRAAWQAPAGAAQSRALLSRPPACAAEAKGVLDVALADERGVARRHRQRAQRGRQRDAATGRTKRSSSSTSRRSATSSTRRSGAPSLMRARASGRRRQVGFKHVEAAIAALPIELQRMAHAGGAAHRHRGARLRHRRRVLVDELQTAWACRPRMAPSVAVLVGRLDEGLGRNEDALTNYRAAAASGDRPAAAQGAAARDRDCATSSAKCRARTWSPSSKRSPRSGAATPPRPRGSSCWRISTPRTGAIAKPSTSCARRCWRIPIPTSRARSRTRRRRASKACSSAARRMRCRRSRRWRCSTITAS